MIVIVYRFKDDKELKAGDLHQLTAGGGGDSRTCVFGVYKCVAENCMGQSVSMATLVGLSESFNCLFYFETPF